MVLELPIVLYRTGIDRHVVGVSLHDDVDVLVVVEHATHLVEHVGGLAVEPARPAGKEQPVADADEDLAAADVDLYVLVVDVVEAALSGSVPGPG